MSKKLLLIPLLLVFASFVVLVLSKDSSKPISGAPPFGLSENEFSKSNSLAWLSNWERPDEPTRVGLQVGHLKNSELPKELEKHIGSTGATAAGYTEAEVNLIIANEVKKLLEQEDVIVYILPATIPPSYWADAFISIHADGNLDSTVRGFKVAPPWRDFTGDSAELSDMIEKSYLKITKLTQDDNITRNMRGYYAFAWQKYEHAIHPMTTAVIVETGFLTNPSDRTMLVNSPEVPARGIADGIIQYLRSHDLL